eukprot:COSAG06_NODE_42109_length_384_cov_2.207018_1_plen_114_part_10
MNLGGRRNNNKADEEALAAKNLKASELKKEADQMMLDGDYSDAAKTYGMAYALDPEDTDLPAMKEDAERKSEVQELKELGEHQSAARDFDTAIATFKKALAIDPFNPEVQQDLK